MYGNRLGWMISAGIVIVMMGLLFLLQQADTISPPTAFARDAAVLQPLPPIAGMSDVLAMTEEGDAADAYRKAIASYKRNTSAYEKFAETIKVDDATMGRLREGVNAIKEGTRLTRATLFSREPGNIINYDSTSGDLPAIKAVGLAAAKVGLLQRDSNPKEALAIFEAVFGLGAKLFNERVTYGEAFAGLELMGSSVGYIGKLSDKLGDKPRAEAAKAFDAARQEYYTKQFEQMARVLTSVDPNVMGRHVGDVFVVANNSQERMWRVEAIRKLGLVRFAAMTRKRKGDQLGALRAARKFATDPDPIIAAAGKAARDLTSTEFNAIR